MTYFSRNFIVHSYFEKNNKNIHKFPIPTKKDNYDFVVWLTLNWFRDVNGVDLTSHKGISTGNIIARRIMSATANDYRNIMVLKV